MKTLELKTFILKNDPDKEVRHEAVQRAVKKYLGDEAVVSYGPKGNPVITGTHDKRYLSVTTTGNIMLAVCANIPVGVDGEYLPRFNDSKTDFVALADRFFTEDEADFVRSNENDPLRFVRVWVRKEAYSKLTGNGISSFQSFSVTDGERFCSKVGDIPIKKFTVKFPDSENYLFAIAGVE